MSRTVHTLCLVTVFALSACGKTKPAAPKAAAPKATPPKAAEPAPAAKPAPKAAAELKVDPAVKVDENAVERAAQPLRKRVVCGDGRQLRRLQGSRERLHEI